MLAASQRHVGRTAGPLVPVARDVRFKVIDQSSWTFRLLAHSQPFYLFAARCLCLFVPSCYFPPPAAVLLLTLNLLLRKSEIRARGRCLCASGGSLSRRRFPYCYHTGPQEAESSRVKAVVRPAGYQVKRQRMMMDRGDPVLGFANAEPQRVTNMAVLASALCTRHTRASTFCMPFSQSLWGGNHSSAMGRGQDSPR